MIVKLSNIFPEIVATARQQSDEETEKIAVSPWQQSIRSLAANTVYPRMLSWSHYRVLLQVDDDTARKWYENEAREQTYSSLSIYTPPYGAEYLIVSESFACRL